MTHASNWKSDDIIDVDLEDDAYTCIGRSIAIFFEILRCIYYHRSLNNFIMNQAEGWHEDHIIFTSSCYLDMAVISWSKLFGSEKSQKLHYLHLLKYNDFKDYFATKKINIRDYLEQDLLDYLNLDHDKFENYKMNSIIKYRDQHVAHHDLSVLHELDNYPKLDIAEASLWWLYNHLCDLLICKKSTNGCRHFAIYKKENIIKQIKLECEKLVLSFRSD